MLVLGDGRANLEREFSSVVKAGRVEHPYSMPYEHFDLFYCRGLHWPLPEIWPRVKKWD
jgi:hypothetical protein